jgi:glycosyltransferase involved in cell wall biosynthesis
LCTVFCYVSLYEGFGLPVVEALASGAVVLTSQISAMPEVAGQAALFADPLSVDSIEDQLAKALGDEGIRNRLKVAGPVRAKHYSWRESAAAVLGRLRQLAR